MRRRPSPHRRSIPKRHSFITTSHRSARPFPPPGRHATVPVDGDRGTGMKTLWLCAFVCVTLVCVTWATICSAGEFSPPPIRWPFSDWQDPADLPPRFRNHCSFDLTEGRYYCSYRCGSDYQFYYCSPRSFGCCHIGVGHCGGDGLLRCR